MFLNYILKNKIKNKIKFIYYKKNELSRKLNLFYRKNNNTLNKKKIQVNFILSKTKYKNYLSRLNNICLVSSRYAGVKKKFKLSRHFLSKYSKIGLINKLKSI